MGYKCMRYSLIAFNFLVLVVGAVAIGLGVWALTDDYGADEMEAITGSDLYMAACIVVIVGGSVVVIISFLGCCGAFKESRIMLGLYFIIMLLFLVLFVVGATLLFFYRDDLEDELEKEMEKTLKEKYGDDGDVTDVWNKIQEELNCCGVDGGLNSAKSWFLWQSSVWFNKTNGNIQVPTNKRLVPSSCCVADANIDSCQKRSSIPTEAPQETYENISTDNPALHETGCLRKVKDEIEDHLVAIAVIAVVAFVIMFLAVVFSVCVCIGSSREKNMVV